MVPCHVERIGIDPVLVPASAEVPAAPFGEDLDLEGSELECRHWDEILLDS